MEAEAAKYIGAGLAEALGIKVVAGSDIARLPEKLKHWVQPAA